MRRTEVCWPTWPCALSGPGCSATGTFASAGPLAWILGPASCPNPWCIKGASLRIRATRSHIQPQRFSRARQLVQRGPDWQPSRCAATFRHQCVDLGPLHLGCPRWSIFSIAFSRVADSFIQQTMYRAPGIIARNTRLSRTQLLPSRSLPSVRETVWTP